MAEEVGFEPTELSFNGFQDRRLQPLGHSSDLKRKDLPFPSGHVNIWGGYKKRKPARGESGRFPGERDRGKSEMLMFKCNGHANMHIKI